MTSAALKFLGGLFVIGSVATGDVYHGNLPLIAEDRPRQIYKPPPFKISCDRLGQFRPLRG
jgi:hypothetical protein